MESDSPDPPVDTHSHGGARHPFERRPHRTLIGLAVPVLGSLIAEPITGLVDTAFVSRLGSEALAGLGVGAIALSAVFWVFNFLGIGTQTEVARALGSGVNRGPGSPAARASLAIGLAIIIGILAGVWGVLFKQPLASLLGASGPILAPAVVYMKIRWLGAPAMLVMLASFGAMRGVQDMRQPLVIAIAINVLNVALDAALIEGVGPIPAMGVAGAAWASTSSQWCGAIASLELLRRSVGFSREVDWADARKLFRIGGDIFVRTGMLTLFLLVATRTATRLGPAEGAAHQAIRQVWIFTALFMDAWALSAQSLVGYFTGAARL
jgi:MATE family multidrug resistance protein